VRSSGPAAVGATTESGDHAVILLLLLLGLSVGLLVGYALSDAFDLMRDSRKGY
jgi:hypothetical protein